MEKQTSDTGFTPFMNAVLRENFKCSDLLLNMGKADINAQSEKTGDTALHVALQMKNKANVVLYLRKWGLGANMKVKNH